MASKKSKILAIAFCAAVMSGIYVNPVLAAEKPVSNGSVTVGYKDFETTTGTGDVEDAQVTITNIASQDEVKQAQQTAEDAATLAGDALSTAKGVEADLAQETADRKKADADLQDQIDGHTNQIDSMGTQLDDLKESDEAQNATLEGHTNQINSMGTQLDDLKANDELQDATLEGHTNQINSMGTQLDDLKANDAVQDADIDKLQANDAVQDDILDAHGQQIGDNTAAIKNHTSVIGVEDNSQLKNEYADTNYISGANDMVEADVILDREISRVDGRVDRLENRVDGLEDRIDKVGAMAAAIANLRTMGYDPAAPTEVAVGVGQYRDETGMALGLFHYPNRDFMLSLSVSTSGDEYMGGIGATWKFGRKSPEKVAEIKKAQAEADARRAEEQKLAKAEEMKKAAKEAKVQAQMERHAKMLAEQEAQAEA